jgi:hypothetical protein
MLYILRADSLIAVGALLVALLWLRKASFPPPSPGGPPPLSWANARRAAAFLLLFYPATITLSALWILLLWFVAEQQFAASPAVFVVRPEPYVCVWGLPGMLLGLLCGVTLLDVALGAIVGPAFHSSVGMWGPSVARDPSILRRTRRGAAVLALVTLPLVLGYVTLFLPWNARFEQDRVVIHDLWAFRDQTYSYRDIAKVVSVAPDAGRSEVCVFFRDGRVWSDEDYGSRTVEYRADDDKFLAFLCEKSGRPLTRVKSFEEVSGR